MSTPATSSRSDLRIGDADRDATVQALTDHHVAGRLNADELGERVATALAARTRGELDQTVADLPAPAPRPAPPTTRPAVPGWRAHVAAYVATIVGLWLVWALTGGGHPWPVWPMLGWGLGILGHRIGPGGTGPWALPCGGWRGATPGR